MGHKNEFRYAAIFFKFDFGYDSLEAGEDSLSLMVARAKIFMFWCAGFE